MSINSEIDMMVADAEAFRGDVLNRLKEWRYNRLKELAAQIAASNSGVKVAPVFFDNHCRNGIVRLDMAQIASMESRDEKRAFSDMIFHADDVIFSSVNEGIVSVAFTVKNMWREFHYDYGNGNVTERYTLDSDK